MKLSKKLFFVITFACFIPLTSFTSKLFPAGLKKVVIDAGHGGHDPGCIGLAKTKEKDVALNVSLMFGKLIEENHKDVQVIYTRRTDQFIELRERAAIANRNKADLFISIHCNASDNRTAYGAETFVMGLHKTKDNLDVAKRENSAILMEKDYKHNYDGFDPKSDEANIIFALYQSTFLDQSLSFASKVQKEFVSKPARFDRGVKQAGFLVLYMTTMPSVLVELGFLSNKQDEIFLSSDDGQQQMAKALYNAFKDYKLEVDGKKSLPVLVEDKKPVTPEKAEPQVKQVSNEKTVEKAPEKAVLTDARKTAGIIFRVQFATSSAPIDARPENFNGLNDIHVIENNGLFRYAVGEERTLEAAKKVQEMVKGKGYSDAFIIAFKNGDRIPVSEAVKELNP